jgi:uncharacterized protein (TIGR02117 family)
MPSYQLPATKVMFKISQLCKNRLLLHLIAKSFLILILSLILGSLLPRRLGDRAQPCDYKVCVSNLGIHSDIIVPVQNQLFDWRKYLSLKDIGKTDNPDYRYLAFGWGEQDFYMNSPSRIDLKISGAFKALFWPNAAVMRVEGYQKLPKHLDIKCFGVSKTGYLNLVNFIQDTFKTDGQNRKNRLGYGISPNVSYFAANGIYSLVRNCNSWTAEGLDIAGVNTPIFPSYSGAIMWHLHDNCHNP